MDWVRVVLWSLIGVNAGLVVWNLSQLWRIGKLQKESAFLLDSIRSFIRSITSVLEEKEEGD